MEAPYLSQQTRSYTDSFSNDTRPPADNPPNRHVCHCGKAFIRKEHLRRHQATHGERTFVCTVCQRSFTRNDLLRRHLTRHDIPTTPDSRRGRACLACHANKTKCDGGSQCTLCSKRGITCTYKLAAKKNSAAHLKGDSSPVRGQNSSTGSNSSTPGSEAGDIVETSTGDLVLNTLQDSQEDMVAAGLQRMADRVASPKTTLDADSAISIMDKEWMAVFIEAYFGRFHESWPILHGPTFVDTAPTIPVFTSVVMIGAWLKTPQTYNDVVVKIHEALMARFLEWLSTNRPRHQDDKPWPTEIYQAIVLNIIFAFYHGSEKLVSKAVLLRGMLVAALREIEFFVCESAAYEQRVHFPGTFLPWILTMRDRWKRLIVALFKIDIYLCIARGQAPSMHRDEIDITMPSTFSLWNAYDLDVFFKRLPKEPTDRAGHKLSEVASNPNSAAQSLLLIEDVQLALCGLFPGIWNHAQAMRRASESGRLNSHSLTTLSWQLETWNADLERISHQCSQNYLANDTTSFPFAAYLAKYNEDPARERFAAMMNITCLVSDGCMTYHLQGLQLLADIRVINTVSRYSQRAKQNDSSASLRIQKHQSQLNTWTQTPESRRALIHAIAVLRQRESDIEANEPQTTSFDPLAYLTISTSALVLWAWVTHHESPCNCVPSPSPGHIDVGVDPINLQSTPQLESWIQAGGTVAVDGIPVCRCVVDTWWMTRFDALLPQGGRRWDICDDVAPVLRAGS